jgi:hypothetical protein
MWIRNSEVDTVKSLRVGRPKDADSIPGRGNQVQPVTKDSRAVPDGLYKGVDLPRGGGWGGVGEAKHLPPAISGSRKSGAILPFLLIYIVLLKTIYSFLKMFKSVK